MSLQSAAATDRPLGVLNSDHCLREKVLFEFLEFLSRCLERGNFKIKCKLLKKHSSSFKKPPRIVPWNAKGELQLELISLMRIHHPFQCG